MRIDHAVPYVETAGYDLAGPCFKHPLHRGEVLQHIPLRGSVIGVIPSHQAEPAHLLRHKRHTAQGTDGIRSAIKQTGEIRCRSDGNKHDRGIGGRHQDSSQHLPPLIHRVGFTNLLFTCTFNCILVLVLVLVLVQRQGHQPQEISLLGIGTIAHISEFRIARAEPAVIINHHICCQRISLRQTDAGNLNPAFILIVNEHLQS